MTTSAAETTVGRVADKEKVEKRRALGRGLESLLPGPRVIGGTAARPAVPPSAGDAGSRAGVAAPHSPSSHGPAVHLPAPSAGEPFDGSIRAVVDEAVEGAARAGAPAPHESSDETITIYAQAVSRTPANLVVNLTIADIDKNPFQTRYVQDDDALEELSDSIKANGVVQPIMVRPSEEEGRYILILGERRLLASKKAGNTQIPALVRRVSLQQAAEMTIVENLQREDLSALEQAEAFRVLSQEFSLTQQQIGERVGLSRTSVTNYMRLLKLPRDVMQLLAEKKISFAEAKELLALSSDDQISKAALYAVKKGLTLEQIERLVLSMNGDLDPFPGMPGEVAKKSGARWVDPNVRAAQMELERMLGVRVRIRDRKGKGKIVIEYSTVDDYDRVVEMLRGKK
ncbi:MAG: ParB/RepB/Spo0J family partition protein [Candidatus Sulfotelmatobacter sp.]